MNPSTGQVLGTALFAGAIIHTFLAGRLKGIGREFVFGLWACLLLVALAAVEGVGHAISYATSLSLNEPLFVFAVMAVASTRPVIVVAARAIDACSGRSVFRGYLGALIFGPLLGCLITEPAAMTVTALILKDRFFTPQTSSRLKFVTLGVLLVNVSIGGVLTHFAAPPVVMVAEKWGWGAATMFGLFGWKAAIAVVLNSTVAALYLRDELTGLQIAPRAREFVPIWVTTIHGFALLAMVLGAHHPAVFLGVFVLLVGFTWGTREHQADLRLRESSGVAFFLAGLVVLGGVQGWWLDPLLRSLERLPLFLGTAALTSFTDNAALTYLGSRVEGISEGLKYALVAGAVAGGGMTVIANAPNPAGFAILQDRFGAEGIGPVRLAVAALGPTLIAMACFWLL